VASIQTLTRAERRGRFHPDHFSLIVVDEGHHAAAITYREVLDHFPGSKRLFVTATPLRGDEVALECVCDSVAFSYGIEPAIDDGWLVPVKQTVVKVDGLDFSKARTLAKDFNAGDLERILTDEAPLHSMVSSAHEIIGKQQALWFCVSVAHAKAAAAVMGRYCGQENVAFLSGDTPRDVRQQVVRAYKDGTIQHLFNCALFLEGFDAPNTAAIVMGRPTKSLSLYMQVLGRGTRPLPGIVDHPELNTPEGRREAIAMSAKPFMNVIDYAGNAGKHKIIQAADVLGGKYGPEERQYAKDTMADEGRTVDLEAALERAKAEMELMDEQQQKRQVIVAQPTYSTQEVNPFVRQYIGKNEALPRMKGEPCSDKHARYLLHIARTIGNNSWTFEKAKGLTTNQARGVIGKMKAKAGIA
jgi:superfamily II DNA or RNA helicase